MSEPDAAGACGCAASENPTDMLPAPPVRASLPIASDGTAFDAEIAHAEGWGVFDCGRRDDGSPHIELKRLDIPPPGTPTFKDDEEVWWHVARRAVDGSALHVRALRMLDPYERMIIESTCGWWPRREKP